MRDMSGTTRPERPPRALRCEACGAPTPRLVTLCGYLRPFCSPCMNAIARGHWKSLANRIQKQQGRVRAARAKV